MVLFSFSRYDPENDKWSPVAPMSTSRIGVGVAVVNRLLYAVGGFDGGQRLSSVECYHPEKNEWKLITPMYVKRSGAGEAPGSIESYEILKKCFVDSQIERAYIWLVLNCFHKHS